MKDVSIILASASPRRKQLLEQLGWKFEVVVPDADERVLPQETPAQLVTRLARLKGEAVAAAHPRSLVIASDTVVVSESGAIYGKPADEADAERMLGELAGRAHHVFSGLALFWKGQCVDGCSKTSVVFRELCDRDIRAYTASGEWRGKAGGYAIQGLGALLVEEINGDYSTVVGLPLALLGQMMENLGFSLRQMWEA